MGEGIEVYAPNGALVTSINSRLPRIIGSITVSASGSQNVSGIFGSPMFIAVPNVDATGNRSLITVSMSTPSNGASTLSWNFPNGTSSYTILYGYY